MEWVLRSDAEVQVILSAIWISTHGKNAEKFLGHGKFDVAVDTYPKPLCPWITPPVMHTFCGRVICGPVPLPVIEIYFLPHTPLDLVFSYPVQP